jgi:hypothetical protein
LNAGKDCSSPLWLFCSKEKRLCIGGLYLTLVSLILGQSAVSTTASAVTDVISESTFSLRRGTVAGIYKIVFQTTSSLETQHHSSLLCLMGSRSKTGISIERKERGELGRIVGFLSLSYSYPIFQSLTVLSLAAEANNWLLGENATEVTRPSC